MHKEGPKTSLDAFAAPKIQALALHLIQDRVLEGSPDSLRDAIRTEVLTLMADPTLIEIMTAKLEFAVHSFMHDIGSLTSELPYIDQENARNTSVKVFRFSTRSQRMLARFNITTMGELADHTAAQLLEKKNFGEDSLDEVRQKLALCGLKLRGE